MKQLLLIFACTIGMLKMQAQQAPSIRTGVTFYWQNTQSNNSDPATIDSVMVNGQVFEEFITPDVYTLQNAPNPNGMNIRRFGTQIIGGANSAGWADSAIAAYKDPDLNHYFEMSSGNANTCGDSAGHAAANVTESSLSYNNPIVANPGSILFITERGGNNCLHVNLYGTLDGTGPEILLGGTFIRTAGNLTGANVSAPVVGSDYWGTGRVNDNGQTIASGLFYMSDIVPLYAQISRIVLSAASVDHGDGKIFILGAKSDLSISKSVDNTTPLVGENVTFTMIAQNSNAAGNKIDTALAQDLLPSGYTYVSHTATQGNYNSSTGEWDLGVMIPGDTDTLTITATVNPTGNYINSANVLGVLFDTDLSNNFDTAFVTPLLPDPDFNVTFVDVPVSGDVSTNDGYPSGTTYGTPVAIVGNPDPSMPTLNSDGTYVFTSPVPGVFQFLVPVCAPGVVVPNCAEELLTITVLDPTDSANAPVANTDIGTTKQNTPITLNTLSNDQAGSPGLNLDSSSVTIIDSPNNGTVIVNAVTGETTYTPNPNFIGLDTLRYEVCDDDVPANCATAYQIIDVKPEVADNGTDAADDFGKTPYNTPISGNVASNDTDPEGHPQSVSPQTISLPEGTLTLSSTGAYTFTPEPGFVGPVDFPYEICDNQLPPACDSATLHILVDPPFETDPDINVTFVNIPVIGDVHTNDETVPEGTTYGSPTPVAGNPSGATPVMNPNGTYTFTSPVPGVFNFLVPVCPPNIVVPNCPEELLTITVLDSTITTNNPVANTDIGSTKEDTPITLNTLANDFSGNPGVSVLVPSTVSVIDSPSNGTVIVNSITGEITYTPNTGFIGIDTLEYEVCDDANPANCATAYQIIDVLPTGAANSTGAADDYATTPQGVAVNGEVDDNDIDPEGDAQNVTPQSTTVPEGTLVLAADGSYTFTPAPNFVGSVNFPYTTCDTATPQACAEATLYITVQGSYTPLSVQLKSFTAYWVNQDAELNWTTILEESLTRFDVERSFDGYSFGKIGEVEAQGVSNTATNYSYIDQLFYEMEEQNAYYRLQIHDATGQSTYSNVIRLSKLSQSDDYGFSPNPSSGIITFSKLDYIERVRIYSSTGRLIKNISTLEIKDLQLDCTDLPTGTYHLILINENREQLVYKLQIME